MNWGLVESGFADGLVLKKEAVPIHASTTFLSIIHENELL